MEASPVNRRLAAILSADIAGYSRLVAEDEEATLRTLAAYRAAIADLVVEHGGRIFGTAGDSVVVEFPSAVNSVRAGVAIQRALERHNADLPKGRRMEFRIGINLGDVVAQGDDLLGDGVNVAARLQEIAAPASICISGAILEQIQGKLNFSVAPLGERSLKNIPRQVSAYRVDWTAEGATASDPIEGRALALPDKPSIAVLPFQNMSGDREQDYFADGITEDIITSLSHHRWFFVIARNSTFAYKDRALDIKQIARDLGVRYVLEGSVRKADNRVRASAQLIEAETGNHLWAERFDRDLADIFSLQDEVTQSVVAAIEPEILLGEGRRAARKNPANLNAFDSCMRASWHFHRFTSEDNRQAETWFRHALELDPDLVPAHVGLARTLNTRIWFRWSTNIDADLADEHAAATRAVALDDRDPYSHYAMSLACMLMSKHDQALAEAQRAIDLNPNFSLGYFALGWIRVFLGHAGEAIDALQRSMRLSPNDPQAENHLGWIALAHYHLHNYEEGERVARRVLRLRSRRLALRTLLACLGQLGRLEEASTVLAELSRIDASPAARDWEMTMPYADAAARAHFEEGLRKAGMQI
jgi:TolB-like protein/class 3 adenylate cyclase